MVWADAAVGLPQKTCDWSGYNGADHQPEEPTFNENQEAVLGQCQGRREAGEYLGDGVKLLEEALCWEAPLTTVVVTEGAQVPELPQGVRGHPGAPGCDGDHLPDEYTPGRAVSGPPAGDHSAGAAGGPPVSGAGRGAGPGKCGDHLAHRRRLGADGLLLVNGCADPYGPKTVRASMGACFRLPVWEAGPEELCALLERSGLPLYATALRADTVSLEQAGLGRCAVIIGSEALRRMWRRSVCLSFRPRSRAQVT